MLPGLTVQANMYYKMLISWTSQKVKETYTTRNAFDFKNGTVSSHVSSFQDCKQLLLKNITLNSCSRVSCLLNQPFAPISICSIKVYYFVLYSACCLAYVSVLDSLFGLVLWLLNSCLALFYGLCLALVLLLETWYLGFFFSAFLDVMRVLRGCVWVRLLIPLLLLLYNPH